MSAKQTKQHSESVEFILWLVSILLAGFFLLVGGYEFVYGLQARHEIWGFSPSMGVGFGIFEMLAAFCLLFRRTAGWSALGLMVLMLASMWAHLSNAQTLQLALPVTVFAALGLIVWGRGLPVVTKAQEREQRRLARSTSIAARSRSV